MIIIGASHWDTLLVPYSVHSYKCDLRSTITNRVIVLTPCVPVVPLTVIDVTALAIVLV